MIFGMALALTFASAPSAGEAAAQVTPAPAIEHAAPAPLLPAAEVVRPPPPPLEPARPPGIDLALRSPPDAYGVPSGLYDFDAQLVFYRDSAEGQAQARRSSGKSLLLAGGVGILLAALLVARAASNEAKADAARERGDLVISDPSGEQYAAGVVTGLVSLGFAGYGLALQATRPDPRPLLTYYRERYAPRTAPR